MQVTYMLGRMGSEDDAGRAQARAAVQDALSALGWTYQDLADRAGVSVETVRNFIAGRRWPRMGKQWRIEDELGWERGRITAIVRANEHIRNIEAVQAAEAQAAHTDPGLTLDLSELSKGDRHKLWALYYDLLEERRRQQQETM